MLIRALRLPVSILITAVSLAAGWGTAVRAAAPDSAARAAPTVVDYSGYQALLNEYLVVTSGKGEPLDTRFDYEKLYDARGRRARMVRIHADLFSAAPSRMKPKQRLAWAINAYNFLVIDVLTENLLVPERGRLRYKSVQDMRVMNNSFFRAPVAFVEGTKYSLDDFERTFLFGGRTEGLIPSPTPVDPRLHFALVCGALGCPPLQPRVFRAESLDVQLDAATRNALRLPRHLRFNPELQLVEASELFNWHANDFGGHAKSLEFVKRYAPASILTEIRNRKLTRIGAFIEWDWLLNQSEKKPAGSSS